MGKLIRCPDCGKEISRKATNCPNCGRPWKKPAKQYGCGGCLVVLLGFGVVAFVLLAINSDPSRGPAIAPDTKAPSIQVGDTVVLMPPGDVAMIAMTDEGWDEMLQAQNAGSRDLLLRLVEQRKLTAANKGTRAIVVKRAMMSTFVRILEGDTAGDEGWIQSEFVKTAK